MYILFSEFCGNFTIELHTTIAYNCSSKLSDMKGDGICHDSLNTESCNFDGGDCCNEDSYFGYPYCTRCECLEVPLVANETLQNNFTMMPGNLTTLNESIAEIEPIPFKGIQKKPWNFAKVPIGFMVYNAVEGDEYCDDELNYQEFFYDGGDCCQGIGNEYKMLHFCTECRCKRAYDG